MDKYPVAEIFYSIQGEGEQSGMPMVFVRLAGCTVGKPYTLEEKKDLGLYVFQNECTTWDGRKFPCDTDYRKTSMMTPVEIVEEIENVAPACTWISLTGGEPLMHNVLPLVEYLKEQNYRLHLETSGTIPVGKDGRKLLDVLTYIDWCVVSPKSPFNDRYALEADEVRILVDEEFDWDNLPESIKNVSQKVWICPVNSLEEINKDNADKCVTIAKAHPETRISLQQHKILGVR